MEIINPFSLFNTTQIFLDSAIWIIFCIQSLQYQKATEYYPQVYKTLEIFLKLSEGG